MVIASRVQLFSFKNIISTRQQEEDWSIASCHYQDQEQDSTGLNQPKLHVLTKKIKTQTRL
jgi:hypothetical protein